MPFPFARMNLLLAMALLSSVPADISAQSQWWVRSSLGLVEHSRVGTDGAVRLLASWGDAGTWHPAGSVEFPISACRDDCRDNVPFGLSAGLLRTWEVSESIQALGLTTVGPTYPGGATAAFGVGLDFHNIGLGFLDDIGLEIQQRIHYDHDFEETSRLTAAFVTILFH